MQSNHSPCTCLSWPGSDAHHRDAVVSHCLNPRAARGFNLVPTTTFTSAPATMPSTEAASGPSYSRAIQITRTPRHGGEQQQLFPAAPAERSRSAGAFATARLLAWMMESGETITFSRVLSVTIDHVVFFYKMKPSRWMLLFSRFLIRLSLT